MKIRVVCLISCLLVPSFARTNGFRQKCFVISNNGPSINVINVLTDTIGDTVPDSGGANTPYDVAFSSDGSKAYVTNAYAGTVNTIGVDSSSIDATADVGEEPLGIAITSDSISMATIYVANSASNSVSVIHAASGSVTATLTDLSFNFPWGVAITHDNQTAYVVNNQNNFITRITVSDNTIPGIVTDTESLLSYPTFIVIVPGGTKAYVSTGSGVVIVETATNQVTGKVTDPNHYLTVIGSIAFTPDGFTAYATVTDTNRVVIIDVATDTVKGLVHDSGSTLNGPFGIAIDYLAPKGYITNFNAPYDISILDTATNQITGVISGGALSFCLAFRPIPSAPVTNNSYAATVMNTPVVVQMSGYDYNNTQLTFTILDGPTNGTLGSITPTGLFTAEVTYTPTSTFIGSDSFTFKVNDGSYDSSTPGFVVMNILPASTFSQRLVEKYHAVG